MLGGHAGWACWVGMLGGHAGWACWEGRDGAGHGFSSDGRWLWLSEHVPLPPKFPGGRLLQFVQTCKILQGGHLAQFVGGATSGLFCGGFPQHRSQLAGAPLHRLCFAPAGREYMGLLCLSVLLHNKPYEQEKFNRMRAWGSVCVCEGEWGAIASTGMCRSCRALYSCVCRD